MEAAVPCDAAATSAATSQGCAGKALFVANILNKAMHNNPAFRTGSELLPGTRAHKLRAGDLAKAGFVEMLRLKLVQLKTESESEARDDEECSYEDADVAASRGLLAVVRTLREHSIHCT